MDSAIGGDDHQGATETTELLTTSRPAMASTLVEVGLTLTEAKALLATLQASLVQERGSQRCSQRNLAARQSAPVTDLDA